MQKIWLNSMRISLTSCIIKCTSLSHAHSLSLLHTHSLPLFLSHTHTHTPCSPHCTKFTKITKCKSFKSETMKVTPNKAANWTDGKLSTCNDNANKRQHNLSSLAILEHNNVYKLQRQGKTRTGTESEYCCASPAMQSEVSILHRLMELCNRCVLSSS